MLQLTDLRCEYRKNPLGIDVPAPRFSWKMRSDRRNTLQTACQIQVGTDGEFSSLSWDTGRVEGDRSVHWEYAGKPLEPLTAYRMRVRAWDNHGRESGWLEGSFETGFLGKHPWQAEWITCDLPKDPPELIPPWILRRSFSVDKPVASVRAYATALGVYELSVNGSPAGESKLNPGWTSYNNWMQYQVYDLTGRLHPGENTIEALVGEGWYSGGLTFAHVREWYGKQNALLLELHIRYGDGSLQVVSSDGEFQASSGPVLLSHLYDGEIYDAQLEGEEHRSWRPVSILPHRKDHLAASVTPPVLPAGEIRPAELIHTPKGERVIDMGQNMVGYLRFRVRGKAGQRVVLKHGEVLDREGNFYFENIREARQEIIYTLKGEGVEEFNPHFTFQGFRYVKVVEYPGEIALEDFTGVVLHTALEQTGEFVCSEPLVNKLQHNILWSQKGNFVDVPTDCPQRDERLGWTADAQVFIPTACFNMDCALFFSKWLRDLREDQFPNGAVPFVVPNALPRGWGPLESTGDDHASAAWGDAATIGPWALYRAYGDRRILEESYGSMRAWLDYVEGQSGGDGVCRGGAQLGDWLALDAYEGSYHGATPNEYVATAYSAYSTKLTEKAARVLGKEEEAAELAERYRNIRDGFRREFLPGGKPSCDTQTAYILPLVFGLVEGAEREACLEGLAAHLERNGGHLTTGFVGTPYLCHALSENGRADLAYTLLLQEDFPSWLYQVKKGATTIWEHWDGIKEDGSFWSADMNSFNHYAYGSIGDWLYRAVAGINSREDLPGYKGILFTPQITGRLDHAGASYQSLYGKAACRWRWQGEEVEIEVEVPANTTAMLRLPDGAGPVREEEGGIPVEAAADPESGAMQIAMGSGRYSYRFALRRE